MHSFFWRWCRRLPSPFTDADRRAGYGYQLAFRQFEVSDTRVFDRPAAGRAFFEGVIRDHLDIGRPSRVALIFNRRITTKTPGTFRTAVITDGVEPQVSCYYKSSRIKQYFKDHRALRTETVICNTRDFGVGRRVNRDNWRALRAVGDQANQRLCDAQASDARPAPDVAALTAVVGPSTTEDGQHAPALRFGDARVMAVLAALVGFVHLMAGFDNHAMATRVAALLDRPYGGSCLELATSTSTCPGCAVGRCGDPARRLRLPQRTVGTGTSHDDVGTADHIRIRCRRGRSTGRGAVRRGGGVATGAGG